MIELMARGGMRIGEVLKLRLKDIQDRKLILCEPKSGKEHEIVFISQKVADRLKIYANHSGVVFRKPSMKAWSFEYVVFVSPNMRQILVDLILSFDSIKPYEIHNHSFSIEHSSCQ